MAISDIGLGASLLQMQESMNCRFNEVPDNAVLHPIAFASKSLSSMDRQYSNIEREALDILHRLEESHHYCSALEVHTTGHRPLVAMISKNAITFPQQL